MVAVSMHAFLLSHSLTTHLEITLPVYTTTLMSAMMYKKSKHTWNHTYIYDSTTEGFCRTVEPVQVHAYNSSSAVCIQQVVQVLLLYTEAQEQ